MSYDAEKGVAEKPLGDSSPDRAEWDTGAQSHAGKQQWTTRFVDSFKRDPNAHVTKESQRPDGEAGREFDHRAAAERTANSGLAHKLKGRHMQMIAIGGSIGELRILAKLELVLT